MLRFDACSRFTGEVLHEVYVGTGAEIDTLRQDFTPLEGVICPNKLFPQETYALRVSDGFYTVITTSTVFLWEYEGRFDGSVIWF